MSRLSPSLIDWNEVPSASSRRINVRGVVFNAQSKNHGAFDLRKGTSVDANTPEGDNL